jgi:hypothetical protein
MLQNYYNFQCLFGCTETPLAVYANMALSLKGLLVTLAAWSAAGQMNIHWMLMSSNLKT